MKIKLLLVDRQKIVLEGLKSLLANQPGMEVAGMAGTVRDAVRRLKKLRPHVVIMEMNLPDLTGAKAVQEILSHGAGARVVVLSSLMERGVVAMALQAGAIGYLSKDCSYHELLVAIHSVVAGNAYISPQISGALIEDFVINQQRGASKKISTLTRREREILQVYRGSCKTTMLGAINPFGQIQGDAAGESPRRALTAESTPELAKGIVAQGVARLFFAGGVVSLGKPVGRDWPSSTPCQRKISAATPSIVVLQEPLYGKRRHKSRGGRFECQHQDRQCPSQECHEKMGIEEFCRIDQVRHGPLRGRIKIGETLDQAQTLVGDKKTDAVEWWLRIRFSPDGTINSVAIQPD
ncbi:MAG: response regulator transcription factor [Verrucomicrobiae bacterium]|nr:response regulator transcription factor [Verrucomicrobiae bacterium]